MNKLVYVKNNTTNTTSILSIELFNQIKYILSENSSYRFITNKEAEKINNK